MGSDTSEEACSMNVSQTFEKTEETNLMFMKSNSQFADGLKDLRNLSKQLYSAAERFESSYDKNDNHRKFVLETSKDYIAKALVSTVDHLGSVADILTKLLEDKSKEFSATSIRFCCVQQRIATCQKFVVLGGMSQNLFPVEAKKYHMQYINPDKSKAVLGSYSSCLPNNVLQSKQDNSCFEVSLAPRMQPDGRLFRRENPKLPSSEPYHPDRQVFAFTISVPNKAAGRRSNIRLSEPVRRSVSPLRFPLRRTEPGEKRSVSPSPADGKRQTRPSEPHRSASTSRRNETTKSEREMDTYTKRSIHLFKAMLNVSNRSNNKDMMTSIKYPERRAIVGGPKFVTKANHTSNIS